MHLRGDLRPRDPERLRPRNNESVVAISFIKLDLKPGGCMPTDTISVVYVKGTDNTYPVMPPVPHRVSMTSTGTAG